MSIRVEVRADHVGVITLDRPEAKNALTVEMRDAIVAAVRSFGGDVAVRAVLITGTGDAFCAGMDLTASTVAGAGTPDYDPRTTTEALRVGVQAFIRDLWEMDKPTVAAVNGHAVGPGAHLALACDFVLVQPRTRFAWSFSKLGLVVDGGGAYLLPRLIGLPKAKALILRSESVMGEEAVELGLAYRCVDANDLVAVASELAAELATGPTRALGMSKRLLNASFETDLGTSLEREGVSQGVAGTTRDLAEGMAAFHDKREARFEGR